MDVESCEDLVKTERNIASVKIREINGDHPIHVVFISSSPSSASPGRDRGEEDLRGQRRPR